MQESQKPATPPFSCHSGLLTDLYELTMAAAYFEGGPKTCASFELFVRSLPRQRSYLLAAGLEQALDYLENVRFRPEEIDFLRQHPAFSHVSEGFFDYLKNFRFSGDVWAVAEGTPVFGEEPLLRISGAIIEAQVVETFLLSTLTFQTTIASKAARVVEAAQGRGVVEFGTRRAHGPEAGVLAARAAYIGGCMGTSNVEAGMRFGIPTYGTLAHSYIMAHEDEEESFQQFLRVFPNNSILLIDTYDTLEAVEKIIRLGLRPAGVRLDSGKLAELSREVRRRLDAAGLKEVRILASGDLQEFAIADLLAGGACVDAFGVGSELATSRDAPSLSGVYKLVEVGSGAQRQARAKLSEGKISYPGVKQVFRFCDGNGLYDHDVIGRGDETCPGGEPLLAPVMRDGRRLAPSPSLPEVREHARRTLAELPSRYRQLRDAAAYPVQISEELRSLLETVANHTTTASESHARK